MGQFMNRLHNLSFLLITLFSLTHNINAQDKIVIKALNGKYIYPKDEVISGWSLFATKSVAGDLESFVITKVSPNKWNFKASNGKFVSLDKGLIGQPIIEIKSETSGDNETFEILPVSLSEVYIRANNGYYLSLNADFKCCFIKEPNNYSKFILFNPDGTIYNHGLQVPLNTSQGSITLTKGKTLIERGKSFIVPFPLNADPRDLCGKGFDEKLNSVGNVFPNVKPVASNVHKYDLQYIQIDNEFQQKLQGSLGILKVGLEGSTNTNQQKRYSLLSVYYIDKVISLPVQETPPVTLAKLYCSDIYYGWSVYYLFEGDAEVFTRSLSVRLGALKIGATAELSNTLTTSNLKTKISLRGLICDPNSITIATTLEDIKAKFKPTIPSEPILANYRIIDNLETNSIPFIDPKVEMGKRYYLASANIKVMNSNKGANWDIDGSAPDILTSFVNCNETYANFESKDSYNSGVTEVKKPIIITDTPNCFLIFNLKDKDIIENENIGRAYINIKELEGKPLNTPIDLKLEGQISSCSIILRELK
ncbi:MAG: hypothetical protein U0Y96_12880 [Candidatus Kapaibacterium sp.]